MGRGRAPCCQKVGLNKGSWSPEEDIRLVSYILKHGHGNWRALPKQAGLLRCGKSCRLRWINYLRPDIKRGNFSKEEEDTIISLHTILGNKWSKIASYLPGRTDNEIKNVWNTHLRKRLSSDNFASSVPAPSMEDDVILGDVAIDPELWNDVIVDIPAAQGKDAGNEQKSWLSYLEEELGLFEDGAGEEQFSAIQDGDLSGVCFHEQTTSYSSS